MNKHTPGPWTHEGQGDITGIEDNGFGRGPVDVCSVYLRAVEGRHEANARLIAAAPDLLDALEYVADIDVSGADDSVIRFILAAAQNKARAAIARARGEA